MDNGIRMVAFDGDDTLWRSQDYFDAAQLEFEQIVGRYIDLADARVAERLYAFEKANLAWFGYGVKGMALSMIEAAVEITGQRVGAADVQRIVGLAKELLRHPVELLPGIRDAVAAVAAKHDVVLITKGDLFHQEAKVRDSGLADLFRRIEIVSEKDPATYARLLEEFGIAAAQFVMVGNSLRSDIAPVLTLGGWGVHMPYHTTWSHESEASIDACGERMRTVPSPEGLPAAIQAIAGSAAAGRFAR
ncbi:HAD family hydrolase [Luteimonas notoginsengisoli]|uniref:HAD family hydrolase n=1 Tax=Luteimonas notoginsengisoli TaxID=1578200 RepID=A0ABV7UYQ5_9GAMM